MDEKAAAEEIEYLQNFLYNLIDMCEVVGNLAPDAKEEAKAFVDKIEAFYGEKNGATKKVNLYQLRNLIEGGVALEIKHRVPEKVADADITLIPEGTYCYDEKHVCPYRKRLYYTDPLNSLVECGYLGVIVEDDPCFGDQVKICGVKDGIDYILGEEKNMEKLHFATPGEILKNEFLDSYGISIEQLAKEINLPEKTAAAEIDWKYRLPKGEALAEKTILDLIAGKIEITDNIAERLAHYFGTSCEFWLNLQKEYNKRK